MTHLVRNCVVLLSLLALLAFVSSCSSDESPYYSSGNEWQIDRNFSVTFKEVGSRVEVTFELKNQKSGWMGLAFNEYEYPADSIVAWYDYETDTAYCWDAYNPAVPSFDSFSSPIQDHDPLLKDENGSEEYNTDDVTVVSSSVEDGVTTIVCAREMLTGDPFDYQIRTNRYFYVWAGYNEDTGFIDDFRLSQPGWTNSGVAVWDLR
ncbi:MAG: hypothetical protein KDD55_06800 [Bdellovibrionales bacterium]|nr:hypothetical protein [Bdellovibrionales bacterium]